MASNSSFNFVEFIRPYITQLAKSTGETVDVSEMQRKRTVFVDQVAGSARLNIVSPIGEAFPLHCLASGKAMLATFSNEDVVKLLETRQLEKHTANTIITTESLLKELNKIRKNGVAFDQEEHLEGVSAVGVSLQEPGGKLYAITIPAPAVRFRRSKKNLQEALLKCRAEIMGELEN
jgi:DNA-binding IclR family transcriptional regulator